MQLIKSTKLWIGLTVVLAIVALHLWQTQEIAVFSAPSADRSLVAQVTVRHEFPYVLGPISYLVVRDGVRGKEVQRHVLRGVDLYGDVVDDVQSLTWNGNTVSIAIDKERYSGPTSFPVKN
jgi:hypothetical protein